jgi:hypothetical protein
MKYLDDIIRIDEVRRIVSLLGEMANTNKQYAQSFYYYNVLLY